MPSARIVLLKSATADGFIFFTNYNSHKGKELEEMDLQAIVHLRPEVVLVDEMAHTNIEGSKNEKRWQDVLEILEAGINVIFLP